MSWIGLLIWPLRLCRHRGGGGLHIHQPSEWLRIFAWKCGCYQSFRRNTMSNSKFKLWSFRTCAIFFFQYHLHFTDHVLPEKINRLRFCKFLTQYEVDICTEETLWQMKLFYYKVNSVALFFLNMVSGL